MRPATTAQRRPVGLRALRRRSVALAAVNLAAAGVGAAAGVAAASARTRCGARERAAVAAVAALAVARIAAMVGMARAQEVTALAVASDADRGDGPTQDFAKGETRVGPDALALLSL